MTSVLIFYDSVTNRISERCYETFLHFSENLIDSNFILHLSENDDQHGHRGGGVHGCGPRRRRHHSVLALPAKQTPHRRIPRPGQKTIPAENGVDQEEVVVRVTERGE